VWHRPGTAARWGTADSAGTPSTQSHATSARYKVAANGEVTALRTRTSNTFIAGSGGYRTVLATGPVNYQTASGSWKPINNTLKPATGGGFEPAAEGDDFDATLPTKASGAFDASQGDAQVDSTLVDATPVAAKVSGSTATYTGVYPSTDALFRIDADAVKETLRLTSAAAPASFSSKVTVAAGSTLRLNDDRTISVVDSDGSVEGTMPAPWMQDSSGDVNADTSTSVSYSISGASPDYTVTVTPSRSWITNPARKFPVLLDPSVTFSGGGSMGCYYSETGALNPSACSYSTGTDSYLTYGQSDYARRTYLKFPRHRRHDLQHPGRRSHHQREPDSHRALPTEHDRA
jgi:hypothetical protein